MVRIVHSRYYNRFQKLENKLLASQSDRVIADCKVKIPQNLETFVLRILVNLKFKYKHSEQSDWSKCLLEKLLKRWKEKCLPKSENCGKITAKFDFIV